ncbi:MAG: lactate racemase domain-containing protein [Candidatus Omnitrophota bacterium]
MKTIIAVPDFTRTAHLKKILPPLIKKLGKHGIKLKDTEILIATGLHRAPTKKEMQYNLGLICNKVKVSSHNYKDSHVSYFGKSKNGVPIYLNKKLKNADSIITVGVVEPHLYAGYSGGIKAVSIGLAGVKTINFTHHPRFLDKATVKLCLIKNNPFRDFIDDIARILPINYSINIVNDKKGRLIKVFEGDPKRSFDKAVVYSKNIFEKKLRAFYDVIICDVPKSKGSNIYQASRIFNYILDSKNPPVNKNPLILVKAGLEEGFGKGLGEKRFQDKMLKLKDPSKLISLIKKRGCLGGEHRAYMASKALQKGKLGFISKNSHLYKDKDLPFLFFKSAKEAKRYIDRAIKKYPRIYYLQNAFTTILVKSPY